MMWIPAQQVSVVAGSEIKLVCFVESHPEALTFWEHNGRMLQPSSRVSIRNQIGSPRYKVDWHFVKGRSRKKVCTVGNLKLYL